MKFIESPSLNPYFNLALEEYLLKESDEEFALIYINTSSIIVGKNQNAYAETNTRYMNAFKIPLLRRLSGGGSVYHDKGNINFCFIQKTGEKQVDNKSRSQLIITFLKMHGLDAKLGAKNEIIVGDFKISGSAEHIYKERAMHHGTLLFSTNLDLLKNSLLKQEGVYIDKTVPSNIATVENIRKLMDEKLDLVTFKHTLCEFIQNYHEAEKYTLDEGDLENIEDIATKYRSWEWNFGMSPKYALKKTVNTPFGPRNIEMNVEKGIINSIVCFNDNLLSSELAAFFTGKQHRYDLLFDEVDDENLLSMYYQLF